MKRGREQSLARVMVPTQSAYVLAARQKPQSGCGQGCRFGYPGLAKFVDSKPQGGCACLLIPGLEDTTALRLRIEASHSSGWFHKRLVPPGPRTRKTETVRLIATTLETPAARQKLLHHINHSSLDSVDAHA